MRRRRRGELDPWRHDSVRDALLVTRALRHERAGYGARLVESSAELLDRLRFDGVDEMERWAEMVRARHRARSDAVRRQQEQALPPDFPVRRGEIER